MIMRTFNHATASQQRLAGGVQREGRSPVLRVHPCGPTARRRHRLPSFCRTSPRGRRRYTPGVDGEADRLPVRRGLRHSRGKARVSEGRSLGVIQARENILDEGRSFKSRFYFFVYF